MSVSREVKRQRREELRVQTRRAVAALERRGVCWSDWARERGFALHAVKDVVRDRNPATRGELFEVAVRIRVEAALLPEPPGLDQPSLLESNQVRAIAARSAKALGACAGLLDRIVKVTLDSSGAGDCVYMIGEIRAAVEQARAAQALLGRVPPPGDA